MRQDETAFRHYFIFDTETGGIGPDKQLLEIGAMVIKLFDDGTEEDVDLKCRSGNKFAYQRRVRCIKGDFTPTLATESRKSHLPNDHFRQMVAG